jgi:hypothetical protein
MKRLLLTLSCLAVFAMCKKEKNSDSIEPEPTPVVPTSNLKGKVNQYDQYGVPYTTGLNTTTVSIEGKTISTVTDTSGKYVLTGITSGTYTLVYKKAGCGLIKLDKAIYKAGDTATFNPKIADIPNFSISNAYVKDTSWFSGTLAGIYYNASTLVQNSNVTLVAILGKSANLTISNPTSYDNYATASLINTLDFNRFSSYDLLKQTYSFKKNDVVFVKIYPVATTGASYFDNTLEKPVYTAYGSPYPTLFTLIIP